MRCRVPTYLLLLVLPVVSATGCRKAERPIAEERYCLGTVCKITLYGRRREEVFKALFDRIGTIEESMSLNLPESEINAVNQGAGIRAVPVSEDTFTVAKAALRYAEITDGAFDVTIGPLVALWDIGSAEFRVPEAAEIAEARELVDYRRMSLPTDGAAIRLSLPGMRLDFGGIAKGFAADAVGEWLRKNAIPAALVDLGGNILACGGKPDGSLWRIGIQNPFESRGAVLGVLTASETAVVTSGTYERYSELRGIRYHHILDPFTGYPADNELASVTIAAGNATAADALSTGAFVLGLPRGQKLIEELPETEGIFVTKEREVFLTSGLADAFELIDGSFRVSERTFSEDR